MDKVSLEEFLRHFKCRIC